MASLKVEIRESINLNNSDYNAYNSHTIRDISDVSRRIVTVPVTESVLIAMDDNQIGAGTFKEESVRYIRITNLSDEWPLLLTLKNEDNDEFLYKLDKKASFIYSGETSIRNTSSGSGVQNSFDANNEALPNTDSMGDLVNITAIASASTDAITSGSEGAGSGTVQCNVELFVATI